MGLATWVPAALLNVGLSLLEAAEAVLNLWPLGIFFGSLAMLCSAAFHRRVLAAIAVPGAMLVGMYFVNALGNLIEGLERVRPLSVFYHYSSAIEDGIEWMSFGGIALCALLLVVLAALLFRRRDIYT